MHVAYGPNNRTLHIPNYYEKDESMTAQTLQVDFDCDDQNVERETWLAFWDSSRSWLAERGYTLFEYSSDWHGEDMGDITCVFPKNQSTAIVEHPYAFFGDWPDNPAPPLCMTPYEHVAYAQDELNRHVVLKLIKENSSEYRIVQYLTQESIGLSLDNFDGIVPPVDFLHSGSHKVLVMPRWGYLSALDVCSTAREVLDFIYFLIKGLNTLHKHHIAHRDIKLDNYLVNHFRCFANAERDTMRQELRREGRLVYGLIDFGISIMFPSTATPAERRLPRDLSWHGGFNQPNDTQQGELDYDPFAFDVGCLGVLLCIRFQNLTRAIPMLAPLMDQMTTRDISRRFTAGQALEFLEEFVSKMTPQELAVSIEPKIERADYDRYDRWHGLPEEFIKKWGHLREPKLPFRVIILRRICKYAWGYKFVQSARRMFRFGEVLFLRVLSLGSLNSLGNHDGCSPKS